MKEFANVNLDVKNDYPIDINDDFKKGYFIFVSDEQDFDLTLDKGDFGITYFNEKLACPSPLDMIKWLSVNGGIFEEDSISKFYHVVHCTIYEDYIEDLIYLTTYGGVMSSGCI